MENSFDFLNMNFFTKASVYPGSIGTFRYRFQRTGWIGDGSIQAWVYENTSFELAQNVETETFPCLAPKKTGGAGDGTLSDSVSHGPSFTTRSWRRIMCPSDIRPDEWRKPSCYEQYKEEKENRGRAAV